MSAHHFTVSTAPQSTLYDEVIHMIQQCDYESALLLVQFILPPYQSQYPPHHIHTLVADIYTRLHQDDYAITYLLKAQETTPNHKRAASIPQQDLPYIPASSPTSSASTAATSPALQLTYKLIDCYIALSNNGAAITALESLSTSSLPLKYILFMAKHYEFIRKTLGRAIDCYMKALNISPFCLAAVNGLVRCNATAAQMQTAAPLTLYQPNIAVSSALGVLSNNNNSTHHTRAMSSSISSSSLLNYITAKHHIVNGAYELALISYTVLTQSHPNSFILLTEMSFVQLNCVEWELARRNLERVRRVSNDSDICGMDVLALLYARRGMTAQLVNLTQTVMTSTLVTHNTQQLSTTSASAVPSDRRITAVQCWNIAALCAHVTKDDNQCIEFLNRSFALIKEQQGHLNDTNDPPTTHHHRHHQNSQQTAVQSGPAYHLDNINHYPNALMTQLIKSFLLSAYQQYLPAINLCQTLYANHSSPLHYLFLTRFYIHALLQFTLDPTTATNAATETSQSLRNLPAIKMKQALAIAVDLSKRFRNNAQAMLMTGLVLSHAADGLPKAERALRKCLKLDSDNEECIIALCELTLRKNDATHLRPTTRGGAMTAAAIATAAAAESLAVMLDFVRGRTVSDTCMCALARLYELNVDAQPSYHGEALQIVQSILKRSPRFEDAKQLLAQLNAETSEPNNNSTNATMEQ